jgi:nitrite reductase/ring-hydroxylating ferredoxin subunit
VSTHRSAREIVLCRLEDLADGESRGFDPHEVGQDAILLVRRGADVRIYRDHCPHEGAPMAWRRHKYLNAARDRIVCYAHGAEFDIDTGVCTLGPCLGARLQRLQHRISVLGEIVLLEARRPPCCSD